MILKRIISCKSINNFVRFGVVVVIIIIAFSQSDNVGQIRNNGNFLSVINDTNVFSCSIFKKNFFRAYFYNYIISHYWSCVVWSIDKKSVTGRKSKNSICAVSRLKVYVRIMMIRFKANNIIIFVANYRRIWSTEENLILIIAAVNQTIISAKLKIILTCTAKQSSVTTFISSQIVTTSHIYIAAIATVITKNGIFATCGINRIVPCSRSVGTEHKVIPVVTVNPHIRSPIIDMHIAVLIIDNNIVCILIVKQPKLTKAAWNNYIGFTINIKFFPHVFWQFHCHFKTSPSKKFYHSWLKFNISIKSPLSKNCHARRD